MKGGLSSSEGDSDDDAPLAARYKAVPTAEASSGHKRPRDQLEAVEDDEDGVRGRWEDPGGAA